MMKQTRTSLIGLNNQLRRVSTVGSQIGRRSLESGPAAFSLCQVVFVTASRSNGWRNVAVRVLNLGLFVLQARDRIFSETLLVCVALMQGFADPIHHLIVKDQTFK